MIYTRFPAGRIKKIMQTDEEVGKVAHAVPIMISRTLELFLETLLRKAFQAMTTRNARTLSPSHVKQCILAETRFDFLSDLVKNIPDVSVAEEKERQMSSESSPSSSRFSKASVPRRVARDDSSNSNSCDVRETAGDRHRRRTLSADVQLKPTTTSSSSNTTSANNIAIDLKKRHLAENTVCAANFYRDTLIENVQSKSVVTVNPTYTYPDLPQPSPSSYVTLAPGQREAVPKIDQPLFLIQTTHNNNSVQQLPQPCPPSYVILAPVIRSEMPKIDQPLFFVQTSHNNSVNVTPPTMPLKSTARAPISNIDFSKDLTRPEP